MPSLFHLRWKFQQVQTQFIRMKDRITGVVHRCSSPNRPRPCCVVALLHTDTTTVLNKVRSGYLGMTSGPPAATMESRAARHGQYRRFLSGDALLDAAADPACATKMASCLHSSTHCTIAVRIHPPNETSVKGVIPSIP